MCSASKSYPVSYTEGHRCGSCLYHHPDGKNLMGLPTGHTCAGNSRITPEEQATITNCSMWLKKEPSK